jgi:hypothetical protein
METCYSIAHIQSPEQLKAAVVRMVEVHGATGVSYILAPFD